MLLPVFSVDTLNVTTVCWQSLSQSNLSSVSSEGSSGDGIVQTASGVSRSD